MTTLPSQIELFNPQTNSNFNLPFHTVMNGKRYDKLTAIEAKYRDVRKEANMLFMLAQTNPEVLKQHFNNQTGTTKQMMDNILEGITSGQYSVEEIVTFLEAEGGATGTQNNARRIETLQVMMNHYGLPDELKVLVEAPATDDFWQEQDILKVREVADSFRQVIRG
jgi:hypothetical protein